MRVVPHRDGATFGTGEYASNALRTERWTKLKTLSWFRKRTSAFAGWTLTSTSSGGISRKERGERITPHHQQGVICLQEGGAEGNIMHPAPIDEEGDFPAVGARQRGGADKPGQAQPLLFRHHLQHLFRHIHAVQRGKDGAPVAIA